MSYFYSEQITYCECIMPREIGWQVINQLGELEYIHFENKEINYDNPYSKSLKRCEQAISKLNDINNFISSINPKSKPPAPPTHKTLLAAYRREISTKNIHGYLYINQIEDEINAIHNYLWHQKKELDHLEKQLHEKLADCALYATLLGSEDFKTIVRQKELVNSVSVFDFKCIMVNRKDQLALEKGIFRISRGHSWVKTLELNTTHLQKLSPKSHSFLSQKLACIIIFQFGQNNTLLNKINRFLSCLETETKNIAAPINRWEGNIRDLEAQIREVQGLESLTNDAVQRYLYKLYQVYGGTGVALLSYLQGYALKEREIYRKLAAMTESKNFLHFSIYLPTANLPLRLPLPEKLPPLTLTPTKPPHAPPTKFSTLPILTIPQQILNTYGIPNYNEFNPAVLYIVTFAFFIGVMFGDVGHMLMAVPWAVWAGGRATVWVWIVIFFMGYSGVVYNQFFGLNLGIFESCYKIPPTVHGATEAARAERLPQCVYTMGIDSIWKISQNKMQFTNSLKMKLAVILGVTHMLLGLAIKILNSARRKNYLALFTLAIPQLVFMLCTFVYMDFLIVYKWGQDYGGQKSKFAPSIINTMIQVYAGFGGSELRFWQGERAVEKGLVIVAYMMIPIMLLGVPLGTYIKRKGLSKRSHEGDVEHLHFQDLVDEKADIGSGDGSEQAMSDRSRPTTSKALPPGHHNEPMSQIWVHSFIETIEYILGTVSNTASYLRLWALSLAHGQLSQVIFQLILRSGVAGGYPKIVLAFFAFIAYYSVTFGVLICMDSMECFLHALRLHWVEFQNKFYEGKGYKFEPFNFVMISPVKEK